MQALTPRYTYTFSRVAAREAVVFKSIIGLLTGRTCAEWEFVSNGDPDLLVLGSDQDAPAAHSERAKAIMRLTAQATNADALSVQLPLRANDVFKCLELAAQKVEQNAQAPTTQTDHCVKLSSWPPHSLLATNPNNLRLATLLGAQAMNAQTLSERSMVPLEFCVSFIAQLQSRGLLESQLTPSPPAASPPATPPGFFARLRVHLGFSAQGEDK